MSVAGYPPHEQRHQMQERARHMLWCRSDWLATLGDIAWEHENMGHRPIEFSGDRRPIDAPAGGAGGMNPLVAGTALSSLASLAHGFAMRQAARREEIVSELSALLGDRVEINEHGAIELTGEQIQRLEPLATCPNLDPTFDPAFMGISIHERRD